MVRSICFFILFLTLKFVSAATFEAHLFTEYEFLPNKPTTMTNSTPKTIRIWCEMHVDGLADNTIYIKELRGQSEVNGTTLQRGNSMYLTIKPLQTIQLVLNTNSQIQFKNLSSFKMVGHCH